MSERERWQELDERATPGIWYVLEHDAEGWITRDEGDLDQEHLSVDDAEFIGAARTAWPAAERECEQLRADNEWLRGLLRQLRKYGEDRASANDYDFTVIELIDQSGLLDDGGQQHG